ncbi:glycosyltransferase family 2 protein [Sphingobacterium faecium]|uniref:glycosyltransferase family 2 protein n=1 Tax=Sphingobacterium faecium TaxID=34087 RepID=UPI000D44D557|nr:glycosyltransferase family 2 protein [Sphingobacterium faecium]PTX12972.1 glycosyltransferase involved in cell wall biosynthesis [Sphingobacterium faecium]
MKLSIITVNLNNKTGLEKTFESINNQTFQKFEHIVIDGLSNDGSEELITNNNRVNYCKSEKDNGVYDAMNKGIKAATGEYILFLNSGDTLFDNNTLEKVILNLDNEDIIYGDLLFNSRKNPYTFNYPSKLTGNFLFKASLPHPASFIKKDLFSRYGMYDQQYKIIADWVFFITVIIKENVSYRHIDQVISNFDTEGMSSKAENLSQIFEEKAEFLRENFSFFYYDHLKLIETEKTLQRIQSSKGYKILKALGVKKFQ